jgi:hypothetical protein
MEEFNFGGPEFAYEERKFYAVYDKTGSIIRSGSVPAHAIGYQLIDPENEFLIETDHEADPATDEIHHETQTVKKGVKTPMPAPGTFEALPEYVQNRVMLYPSVQEQMDMLWHAMDDGVSPKIEPWYSLIKGIKESHPAPAGTSYGQ